MTGFTFSQIIDFTRTSAATFVNSSGNIASTPQSRNLLTFTQQFDNAAWTKTNATVVPNQNPAAATLGAELVTNGDFASGTTGWTDITGSWAVTGGALAGTSISASAFGPYSNGVATANRIYLATFTITVTSGSVLVRVGNTESSAYSTGGTYSQYFVATSSAAAIFQVRAGGSGFTGTIDNISVREVVGGWNVAPDGTSTADTLIEDTTNAAHTVSSGNATVPLGAVTWSVFAKAGTRSWMWINAFAGSNNRTWFNLSNGTVGTTGAGATASITSAGNGWYRCSVTLTSGTTTVSMGINAASADNTTSYAGTANASALLIWGAQLEANSTATDYTRNVGGTFPPRFDYDPVTLAPRGLLIEEQRVNLLTYSEQFDDAVWIKGNATVTANAATSPDGTVGADAFTENSATGTHQIFRAVSFTSGTAYTVTIYAKPNVGTRRLNFAFTASAFGSELYATFNLATQAVAQSAGVTASMQAVGNGWFRCQATATATATASSDIVFRLANSDLATFFSYAGDGTSSILLWGAQLEAGAFATSYIPTVASQVTRAADIAAITGPNFTPWYNQSAGTFVAEGSAYAFPVSASNNTLVALSDGSTTNASYVYSFGSAGYAATSTGGVVQANPTSGSALSPNTPYKMAYAFKANDFAFSVNGAAVGADASGTIPTVNQLQIGRVGATVLLNGHIRSIRYYPSRLTDAQLQALTA